MRPLLLTATFIVLAACGTEEEPAADTSGTDTTEDAIGDAGCIDGQTRTEDCNTCECISGEWMCTTRDCADIVSDAVSDVLPDGVECLDGQTRMEDCNTCECLDGRWSCTEMACNDVVEGDTEDVIDSDVEACLAACGVGCPAPQYQICGTNGQLYCNPCIMECYGVDPADSLAPCWDGVSCEAAGGEYVLESDCNRCECDGFTFDCTDRDCGAVTSCVEACDDACPAPEFQSCGVDGQLYCNDCVRECNDVTASDSRAICGFCQAPEGLTIDWSNFEVPESCTGAGELRDVAFAVFENETDAREALGCPSDTPIAILFPDELLVRAVFTENPAAEVFQVQTATDSPDIGIYMSAPPYCSGPRPFDSVLWLVIDNTGGTVEQHTCIAGRCPPGPPVP